MGEEHRAQHRESEGDYYAHTQQNLETKANVFSAGMSSGDPSQIQAETQREASAYSVSQSNALLQGQSTRGDAPTPNQNYASHTHEDLYGMVHGPDMSLDDLNARSVVTNQFGNWLADQSNAFRDASTTAGASWQGKAAESAGAFFNSTADHTEKTGSAVQLVSNHYSQQSAAADHAQRNMPEPTGFDQKAEMAKVTQAYNDGDWGKGAGALVDMGVKQQQADAAHAQAVQVMQGLDSTYHATASSQPTYVPPPQPNDSTTASSYTGPSSTGGFNQPGVGGPGGGQGGNWAGGPGGTPGPSPAPGQSAPVVPPGVTSGSGQFGAPGGSAMRPGLGGGLRMPGGDGLAVAGPGGGVGNAGEDIVRGKPGRGAGFAGSRVSGGGYAPKGEPSEGSGGAKTGGTKPDGERLARGGVAAAEAAGKPGKGAAGAAGAGAGKKKEEDKEHKNKIAVPDDEIFEVRPERGPDGEKITPPVIG